METLTAKPIKRPVTPPISSFFREPSALFTARNLANSRDFNSIAVIGCAYGEQVYDLAALLDDANCHPKITGYDINQDALKIAKNGRYQNAGLVRERFRHESLRKFYYCSPDFDNGTFTEEIGDKVDSVEIPQYFKTMVSFSEHNILYDPLPNPVDLIFCTNVLYYFVEDSRIRTDISRLDRALLNIRESLSNQGVLVTEYNGSTDMYTPGGFMDSYMKRMNANPFFRSVPVLAVPNYRMRRNLSGTTTVSEKAGVFIKN